MTRAIIYHILYMLYNIKIEHTMYQVDTYIYIITLNIYCKTIRCNIWYMIYDILLKKQYVCIYIYTRNTEYNAEYRTFSIWYLVYNSKTYYVYITYGI